MPVHTGVRFVPRRAEPTDDYAVAREIAAELGMDDEVDAVREIARAMEALKKRRKPQLDRDR
jgi:hypothetical protein